MTNDGAGDESSSSGRNDQDGDIMMNGDCESTLIRLANSENEGEGRSTTLGK